MAVLSKILKEEGALGLLKGLESKLVWSGLGKFVYYGSYSFIQSMWVDIMKTPMGVFPNFAAGYVSEFCTVPFSLPFEAIATKIQTSKGLSFGGAVSAIIKERGILGFYAGVSSYIPLCITPAVTNTFFTQIKNLVLKSRGKPLGSSLPLLESFLLGAVARTIAVCLMFPFLRAKTLIQGGSMKETSALAVIKALVKKNGILSLYNGLGPELLRGVLSSAVTLMMKERIYVKNRALLLSLTAAKKVAVPVAVAASAESPQ